MMMRILSVCTCIPGWLEGQVGVARRSRSLGGSGVEASLKFWLYDPCVAAS